jgi:hypothetical protein
LTCGYVGAPKHTNIVSPETLLAPCKAYNANSRHLLRFNGFRSLKCAPFQRFSFRQNRVQIVNHVVTQALSRQNRVCYKLACLAAPSMRRCCDRPTPP